jgi:DNA invertase Pin-like site-specific DNA recombinase
MTKLSSPPAKYIGPPKVAIYARVSTPNGSQTPETQLRELRIHCERRGWQLEGEYVDAGVSGAKEKRPQLDKLMADAHHRKFDIVLVWKLDRFGRSLRHLVNSLAEFEALGIAFVSMTDSLDMTTPQGRLMFQVIAAMTEFERELIRERVKAGMRNAKAKGHIPGPAQLNLDLPVIRARLLAGESQRQVAISLGVSPSLLSKRLRA